MEDLRFVAILATLFAVIGFVGWYLDSPMSDSGKPIADSAVESAASVLLILAAVATVIAVIAWVITLRKASVTAEVSNPSPKGQM
jgi:hypothetical protein